MIDVLIVDDDSIKAARLREVVAAVEGVDSARLDVCGDLASARDAMKAKRYDLVVLDVALPHVNGGRVARDGGVTLLEEVIRRPKHYKMPGHFVGITGYEDVSIEFQGRFAGWLWTLAFYAPERSEWREGLEARVRHIVDGVRSEKTTPDYDVDCCVLTALFQPELTQVLALPLDWLQVRVSGDETIYWKGTLKSGGKSYTIALGSAARMGLPAAATATTKMISAFRPRVFVMCGIMAGVKGKVEVGDVIVSSSCWDWGNGKWVVLDGEAKFLPAPHQVSLANTCREQVKVVIADRAILEPAWQKWTGLKPESAPRVRMGITSSGAAVLADKATIHRLVREHRELLGIDMELYGACVATEEVSAPRPKMVGLKSVVDFANGAKSDKFQEYGAYISANALVALVPRIVDALSESGH